MKKIIGSMLLLTGLTMVSAQDFQKGKPMMARGGENPGMSMNEQFINKEDPMLMMGVTGDKDTDTKVKALRDGYVQKLKALQDQYKADLKVLIGDKKLSASSTMMNRPMMNNATNTPPLQSGASEAKPFDGKGMMNDLNNSSTSPKAFENRGFWGKVKGFFGR